MILRSTLPLIFPAGIWMENYQVWDKQKHSHHKSINDLFLRRSISKMERHARVWLMPFHSVARFFSDYHESWNDPIRLSWNDPIRLSGMTPCGFPWNDPMWLSRVALGGHDIPEKDIRKRWDSSRRNLIKLLPSLHSLRLYDNSHEADPHTGKSPTPQLLLHIESGKVVGPADLSRAADWAKPIIAGALKTNR